MSAARLILWDIDGTLLNARGLFRPVMEASIQAVTARPCADIAVDAAGKTDPNIARQLLLAIGTDPSACDDMVHAVMQDFALRSRECANSLRETGFVYPGVVQALRAFTEAGVRNGVLTGNLRENAELKLQALRLDPHLDLDAGSYGSDGEDRNALVDIALQRAEAHYGERFNIDEVWIIGDTPHDLSAAAQNGLPCALVATGRYAYEDLVGLGAQAVFHDLRNTEAVVEALLRH